jgi:hypothetical protein
MYVSYVFYVSSFIIYVCVMCCFCNWPSGWWLSTSINMNWNRPTQPSVQWAPGFFPGGNYAGRGIIHSLHLAPKLRKEYSYTCTDPMVLHGLRRTFLLPFYLYLFWNIYTKCGMLENLNNCRLTNEVPRNSAASANQELWKGLMSKRMQCRLWGGWFVCARFDLTLFFP